MLNQITAAAWEDKVCVDLTADDDADAGEDRNTSSSSNALFRTAGSNIVRNDALLDEEVFDLLLHLRHHLP